MSERQLLLTDSQGHKRRLTLGDRDHLKFLKAFDDFLKKHVSAENSTFQVESVITGEALVFETHLGIVGRVHGGEDPATTYRRCERHTDGADLRLRFAFSGSSALDVHGPWTSDRESLLPDATFENPELAWVMGWRQEEQRRREVAAMPKLDKKALTKFCTVWADTGHDERVSGSEVYHVLFGGRALAEVGEARGEMLSTIKTLGLEVAGPPPGAPTGEVWVRSDPRLAIELEKWA